MEENISTSPKKMKSRKEVSVVTDEIDNVHHANTSPGIEKLSSKKKNSERKSKNHEKKHAVEEDGEKKEKKQERRVSHQKQAGENSLEGEEPITDETVEIKVYNQPIDASARMPAIWRLEDFTEDQNEKIKQFRAGIAAEFITKETDLQIARWLVARKWDVEVASKMFIDSCKWRKTENVDNIMEWITNLKAFQFLSDYWPISILPTKKSPRLRTYDGSQVIYERLTEMHPDILDIVQLDEMIKFHIYQQELCALQQNVIFTQESPNTYSGVVYVYDLSSLTLLHLTRGNYSMFQTFSEHDANNYPETLRRVFLINSPAVFTMGWKVAKKFLDPVTIKKIVILGTDYEAELKKVIPPECLPRAYGGTLDYLPNGGGSIKGIKRFE